MGDPSAASPSVGARVVESLAQGVIALDPHGRVLHANPAARALLGLAGRVEGQDLGSMLAEAPEVGRVATAALTQPAGIAWTELPVRIGGRPRLLGVHWAPLRGEDGSAPAGVVLSLVDLSAARTAESAARQLAALAGVSRLTHRVAHDLKNPLGALKLYALLLERHVREAKPDGRELTEKIARAIDHLAAVVTEVTAFGLPGPLDRSAVALAPLADASLATLAERVASAGVEVVRRDEPGVTALADARALRRVLEELVENALDAMKSGGRLTVSSGRTTAKEVEVAVEDTGAGMPADVQARLFEPFFTTKTDAVGLGMAIASQVIGQHGGRIEVRSEPSVGTAVRIVLPAA
jgi:signal transduction histidine kinase